VRQHHWQTLQPWERRQLADLLRRSRGRPANLTASEREDFRRLVGKLDWRGLVRDLTRVGLGAARSRRRR
jgi:hypothetical protein